MQPSPREVFLSRALLGVLQKYAAYLKRAGLLYILAGDNPSASGMNAAANEAASRGAVVQKNLTTARWARMETQFGFRPHGLPELIAENKNFWIRSMRNAKDTTSRVINDFIITPDIEESWKTFRSARRRLDNVRSMTLDSLFKAYKKESPVAQGSQILQNKLRQFTTDGLHFPLRIKPTSILTDPKRFRIYDVRDYAEMATMTTVREAQTKANFAAAEELETELMIYPKFDVDYKAKGDAVCARINGEIFSTNPNGSYDADGNKHEYIFGDDGLARRGGYITPHPRCRHIPKPISAVAAAAIMRRRAA